MKKLEGKVVLITGAGGGIGLASAKLLAQEGAHIVATDINLDNAKKTSQEASVANPNNQGFHLKVDVTKAADCDNAVKQTVDKFGRLDVLYNAAGILKVSTVVDMPEEDWDAIMDVNAKGTFLMCRAGARQMIKQKGGKIINIASIIGKKASIYHAHYCASKFAVIGLTQTLAIELAPYNINVNAVCPGAVDDEMFKTSCRGIAKQLGVTFEEYRKRAIPTTLLGRFELPEDVAPLVVFLASKDADFMTGQSVNICGGIQFH